MKWMQLKIIYAYLIKEIIHRLNPDVWIYEDLKDFISNYNGVLYGIFNENNIHVGNLGFNRFEEKLKRCNTGILLSKN